MRRLSNSLLLPVLWLSIAVTADAADVAPATVAPGHTYFHKYLSGVVGDKLRVTMDLKNLDGLLTGSYSYGSHPLGLDLRGRIDASGSFAMDESIDRVKKTGSFKGSLSGGHIVGTWQSADGLQTLPFFADQTSEIRIGTKREMLGAAVGKYPLSSIASFAGANSLGDTLKKNGRWTSFESSISGGRREGQEIPLAASDVALLNNLGIVVEPDLSVRLVARGKTVLQIAFRPDGMDYRLDGRHSEVIADKFKPMSTATIVLDERLYLLVRDGVDYTAPLSGSFMSSASDIIVVSYSLVDKTISMQFKDGQCCGGTTWTFGPRKR